MIRPFSACLVLVLVAGSVRATGPHAATAPVPPTQEIELLDPGVDPTGKPAAIVRPDPNNPGLQQVDVPPAILVHKFYYTGDRTFQGPMLPGGPTIAALNHPKTGERTYVNIVLPPGAPKITYSSHAIRYDYGPQSVTLSFGVLCGKPTVHYSQATKVGNFTKQTATAAVTGTKNLVQRLGIPQGMQRFGAGAKNAIGTVADHVHDASQMVLLPVVNGLKSLPGAQLLQSTPEAQAEKARDKAARQAERMPNPDSAFIKRP